MKVYFQTKSMPAVVKDIDSTGRIVKGYFASFATLDDDGDIFQQGAFAKSIRENGPQSEKKRIKHLFNHWDAVGVLQEMQEDATGLFFISKMGRHTLGDDVLKMYEDGIVTEHSVGFRTVSTHKDGGNNIITEARLWEGSSLDKWGANMNTPVVKSQETIEQMISRLDKLQKALRDGSYTDETMVQFEIQVKQIQQYLSDTTQAVDETPAPEKVTAEQIKSFINQKLF